MSGAALGAGCCNASPCSQPTSPCLDMAGRCAGCRSRNCDCPTELWLGSDEDRRIPRNYGWRAHLLADHSFTDLELLRQIVMRDPKSANPEHAAGKSIFLYTKSARRKLDALAWAVTTKLNAQRHEADATA